jgi:hypothetical protein
MLSLAQATAEQVSQALAAASSSRDIRLLQEYNRACRHAGGIVLALGNDIVMLNDHARRALGPGDQAALITQAGEALGRRQPGAVTVDLPSGTVARMFCHVIAQPAADGGIQDGVVHVKLLTGVRATTDADSGPGPAACWPRFPGRARRWPCRASWAAERRGGGPAAMRRPATTRGSG